MPKQGKKPYNATIRFRGYKELARRIERVIETRGYGNAADFLREGTTLRVEEEEKRLRLPPLQTAIIKPVKYSKAKGKKKHSS